MAIVIVPVNAVAVLANASRAVTCTAGAIVTPAVALLGCCEKTRTLAAPGVALAVKATGLPLSVPLVALNVLLPVPAVAPSVQLVSVAIPLAPVDSVAGDAGLIEPPPAVTVKVTLTP